MRDEAGNLLVSFFTTSLHYIIIFGFGIYPIQQNGKNIILFAIYRVGGEDINAKDAVARRIEELCKQADLTVNALADLSGVSPSTVYSMLNTKSKNPGVVSIQKLCDGLEISVRDFFDSPLFENLEQVIQ